MLSKKEFISILKSRDLLKKRIKQYKIKLECAHKIDKIQFSGHDPIESHSFGTNVTCIHCQEGFAMTHSEDGSCMSQKHMDEYNAKKKTKQDNKWFANYLNGRIQQKIDDIQTALDSMYVINFYKRLPFQKSRLEILQFDKGGTCVDMYGTAMGIVTPQTYWGNKHIFVDSQLEIRNGTLSSADDSEWGEE